MNQRVQTQNLISRIWFDDEQSTLYWSLEPNDWVLEGKFWYTYYIMGKTPRNLSNMALLFVTTKARLEES